MSDPLEFLPGFVSPLTDSQHAAIGRIALLWGQIEHFIDELTPAISGLTRAQLDSLQVSSKSLGSKVAFLLSSIDDATDPNLSEELRDFCTLINDTKTQRNHVFHGVWGWRGDSRRKRVFPAARKQSEPRAPFPASKLKALEKKLCRCSRLGWDIVVSVVHHQSVRPHPSRFLHHGSEDVAPSWLLEWSERNPWDCNNPGRIEIAGELPRLKYLFPEK